MGGKSSTPDYGKIAVAEGEQDREMVRDQIFANRPNQFTPWGYTSWTNERVPDGEGGYTTRWNQTTGLTPALQEILNKQVAIEGGKTDVAGSLVNRMGSEFSAPLDWRGLTPMGTVPSAQFTIPEPDVGDPNRFRQSAQDAAYSQAMSRIDPLYAGKRDQLETRLRGQGLTAEDASWQAQMEQLGMQENDSRNQALWSSVGAGRDEADSMFGQMMDRNKNAYQQAFGANQANYGQMMQGSQYANAIRQQQITEAMQKRGFSLNEINALMSGSQVSMPNMPDFMGAGRGQGADLMGGAMANANAQQAQQQQTNQALGTAATAAAMFFSDRRLKTDIRRVGTTPAGYPWYTYTYVWGEPGQGVMADEVPEEFTTTVAGYKAVDYGRLLGD